MFIPLTVNAGFFKFLCGNKYISSVNRHCHRLLGNKWGLPCTVSALFFYRLANQRILELESQVEELQQHFTDLQQQLRKAEEEKETKDSQLEEWKVSTEEHSMYGFRNDLFCDTAACTRVVPKVMSNNFL